jgi:hypothetical protein
LILPTRDTRDQSRHITTTHRLAEKVMAVMGAQQVMSHPQDLVSDEALLEINTELVEGALESPPLEFRNVRVVK